MSAPKDEPCVKEAPIGSSSSDGGARSWFANLPSAEEKAAASAITDVAFLQMLLDFLSQDSLDSGGKLHLVSHAFVPFIRLSCTIFISHL